MSRFAVKELEKRWKKEKAQASIQLTPGILGKIAICVLFLHGNNQNGFFNSINIEDVFLKHINTAPKEILDILHIEIGLERACVRELTEMTLAIQRAGIAGRINPEYKKLQVKWDVATASELLSHYNSVFPSIVDWIKRCARV